MTTTVIQELIEFLSAVETKHYTRPSNILSSATIGQHIRHSIEMYQCILKGYNEGVIDYGKRKRDLLIESFPNHAIDCLQTIFQQIEQPNKELILENEGEQFATSYKREVFYCDEHTIHHMALIRVGINEIGGYQLKESFGVAPSTIKYRQACAQ